MTEKPASERERAEFEAWADDPANPLPVRKHEFGRYDCERACAWGAWQAARREERLQLYSAAASLSMKAGQVVGEKSDYYITLQQLESLLATLEKEEGA